MVQRFLNPVIWLFLTSTSILFYQKPSKSSPPFPAASVQISCTCYRIFWSRGQFLCIWCVTQLCTRINIPYQNCLTFLLIVSSCKNIFLFFLYFNFILFQYQVKSFSVNCFVCMYVFQNSIQLIQNRLVIHSMQLFPLNCLFYMVLLFLQVI